MESHIAKGLQHDNRGCRLFCEAFKSARTQKRSDIARVGRPVTCGRYRIIR
jgi:hypothetical protein